MSWLKIDFWWAVSLIPSAISIAVLAFAPLNLAPMTGLLFMLASVYLGYAIFNDGTCKLRQDNEKPLAEEPPIEESEHTSV